MYKDNRLSKAINPRFSFTCSLLNYSQSGFLRAFPPLQAFMKSLSPLSLSIYITELHNYFNSEKPFWEKDICTNDSVQNAKFKLPVSPHLPPQPLTTSIKGLALVVTTTKSWEGAQSPRNSGLHPQNLT